MNAPRVIVVLLRRPRQEADERRDAPFWEFGSFGCTGCHRRNLMNPRRANELKGARFAFVQGGDDGYRLVHVTPLISVRHMANICEAVWSPEEMPLTYATAPLVIDNLGRSDIPLLAGLASGVRRSTALGKFASAFRSRREPLPVEVAAQVLSTFNQFRKETAEVASSYDEAMPYPPPKVEQDRAARYEWVRSRSQLTRSQSAED
jgi:hypothetical protein